MLHETLWSAVTVLISVLGLIIWRYASSQKRSLYTQEALQKNTIKKSLNTVPPPVEYKQTLSYKSEPIVRYTVPPKVDNPWKPSTLDVQSILQRRPVSNKVAAAAKPLLDDIPYLTLQPQYQPKPPRQTKQVDVLSSYLHRNNEPAPYHNEPAHYPTPPQLAPPVIQNGSYPSIYPSLTNNDNEPMQEVNEEVQSPSSRKRVLNEEEEQLQDTIKKTRTEPSENTQSQPQPTVVNEIQAQPSTPAQQKHTQQVNTASKTPLLIEYASSPIPATPTVIPPSTPLTNGTSRKSIARTPATPANLIIASTPNTGLNTPWSPYVPNSRTKTMLDESIEASDTSRIEGEEEEERSNSKKRSLHDQPERAVAEQKRRRVPVFSTKKKAVPASLGLTDTVEDEEREKRVLFILKRAQDAPYTPNTKPTPTKVSLFPRKSTPYKSVPFQLPKLPKYTPSRPKAPPASSSLTTAPLSLAGPFAPLTTSTSTSSSETAATTTPASSALSALVPLGTAPSSLLSLTSTPPSQSTAPVMSTPTFGPSNPTLSAPSALSTPTFGFPPPASTLSAPSTACTTAPAITTTTATTTTAPTTTTSTIAPSNPTPSFLAPSSTTPASFVLPSAAATAPASTSSFVPPATTTAPTIFAPPTASAAAATPSPFVFPPASNPPDNPATNPTINPTTNPTTNPPTANPLASTTTTIPPFAPATSSTPFAPPSTTTNPFASSASSNLFAPPSTTPATTSANLFAPPSTTTANPPNPFAAPATTTTAPTSNPFASSTTSANLFAPPATTTANPFAPPSTTTANPFAAPSATTSNPFAPSATTSNPFAPSTTTNPPTFNPSASFNPPAFNPPASFNPSATATQFNPTGANPFQPSQSQFEPSKAGGTRKKVVPRKRG